MKKNLPETIEKAIIQRQSRRREAPWLAMGPLSSGKPSPRSTPESQEHREAAPPPGARWRPGQSRQSPEGGSPSRESVTQGTGSNPGCWAHPNFLLCRSGWGLRICMSNKLPVDLDAADLGTTAELFLVTNEPQPHTQQSRVKGTAPCPGDPLCLYGVGRKVRIVFFYKIKDTCFIFTDNFIDLDIMSLGLSSRW